MSGTEEGKKEGRVGVSMGRPTSWTGRRKVQKEGRRDKVHSLLRVEAQPATGSSRPLIGWIFIDLLRALANAQHVLLA